MLKFIVLVLCVIALFDSATIVFAQPLASTRSVQLLNFADSPIASAHAVVAPTGVLTFDLADKLPYPIPVTKSLASTRSGNPDILAQLRADFVTSHVARSHFRLASFGNLASRAGCPQSEYRAAGFLAPHVEARRRLLYPLVAQSACRHQLPVTLLDALIVQESGYDWSARSHAGAYGLTQLMPATARDLRVNRYSVLANLEGGARYLKSQLNRFGAPQLALAAYNAGPLRVERRWAVPNIRETRNYVARILRIWRDLSQYAVPLAANTPDFGARDFTSVGSAAALHIADPVVQRHRAVALARF